MTVEQMKRAHEARPFRPFTVHLADGRSLRVRHPELLAFSVSGRTISVAAPDDAFEIVDLLLVVSIDFSRKGSNGRPARAR
jgi:hypothetical protein